MAERRSVLRLAKLRAGIAHVLIVACCAGGMLAWTAVLVLGRSSEVFVQDWIVYYAAGTAYLKGELALIFDATRFTEFQHATLARWYSGPLSLHPWLYPPHYLLLLVPFALLPFAVSYAAFQLGTGLAAVASLAWQGAGRGMAWPRGLMLLFFPASCINGLTGQNAFLTTALLVGGVRLLERQPVLGGAALGALSFKPHFLLMVPVALVALRAWRALAACIAAALLLMLASAALFGVEPWRMWFEQTVLARDPAYGAWFSDTFLRGYSLYVCTSLLGASESAARWVQLAAVLAAAACVWTAFRRAVAADLRLAVILIAAVAVAPHVMAYDLVLLGAAVILLFASAADGIGAATVTLFGLAWASPLLRPSMAPIGRVLIPVALIGSLAYALDRALSLRKIAASAEVLP